MVQKIENFYSQQPSKDEVKTIDHPVVREMGVAFKIVRMDQNHRYISGNKLWKLKYNLIKAAENGVKRFVTFGGAYSNHIHAAAAAGKLFGFETVGVIRGERPKVLNPTLVDAQNWGMQLRFIERRQYKHRHETDFQQQIMEQCQAEYLVPEGGSNALAVNGVKDWALRQEEGDVFCLATGTGGTTAGVIAGAIHKRKVLSFPVLKGGVYLKEEIESLLKESSQKEAASWQLMTEYHFGGYAKYTNELIEFINMMKQQYQVPLDPVYTGKVAFGVLDMIKKGCFSRGTTIVMIHTGGLQGIRGFNDRFGQLVW